MSKLQFDSTIGGKTVLPHTVNVINFISSRSQEISALAEAIGNPQRTSLISQRLPKHMQRRVMSHNSKRLPIALRQFSSQSRQKPDNSSANKRSRQKYRQRPQNLRSEYERRQQNFLWLESHVWHAKRFHMINKWSFSLPNYPNDKNFRACYRASVRHCLLQDVSYHRCIEITGHYNNIVSGLNRLTSSECGLTFKAEYFLKGGREGTVLTFCKDRYPYGVIGPVKFMWKPCFSSDYVNMQRSLWIWVHPAYYGTFRRELIDVFQLKERNALSKVDKESDSESSNGWEDTRDNIIKYESVSHTDICVIELRRNLRRLRLTGPLSQSVITDAFSPLLPTDIPDLSDTSDWISEHYSSRTKDEVNFILSGKHKIWTSIKNVTEPAQLPSSLVIPLIIRDPRFTLPDKRTKINSDIKDVDAQLIDGITMKEELTADNPLWNESIINKVVDNKLSAAELNTFRSKQLVPGTSITVAYDSKHYLPVILILNNSCDRRSNGKRIGFAPSSWDIILPAGWVMPVWLSLVWRGARVGGLRETDLLYREAGVMSPITPDSVDGQTNNENEVLQLTKEYFKKPPAKRPNYNTLNIVSPVHYPWKELLKDWNHSSSQSSFFVLRDRTVLNKIETLLKRVFSRTGFDGSLDCFELDINPENKANALIGIFVTIIGRGNVDEHAVVCLPVKEDLDVYCNREDQNVRPIEPVCCDPNKSSRTSFDKNRRSLLKRLKRKLIKCKRSGNNDECTSIKSELMKLNKSKQQKMNALWLPGPSDVNIKDSANRKMMGMVVSGGYTFTHSCSTGLAYIPVSALCHFVSFYTNYLKTISTTVKCKPVILVRTPASNVYSFATFNVLLPNFI